MKIFKWYLIDDIDKMCLENGLARELKRRLDILEKRSWEQYLKIEKLKKENEWLKNHQKIEIVNLGVDEGKSE